MKRALKWLGYAVGAAVVVILLVFGTAYGVTISRLGKTYPTTVENIAVPTDSASIATGQHLATAIGKCQSCHGVDYGGTRVQDNPAFMSLTAPNLTAGRNGISGYADADYVRAIRYGVGRDGKPLIFMPSGAFHTFNDADLGRMIAYLKTLPAVDMAIEPKRSVGPIARMVYLVSGGEFALIPAERIARDSARLAVVAPGPTKEYGEYLMAAGACSDCHGANLTGAFGPNMTPGAYVGTWSEADFAKSLRQGIRPDGRVMSAEMPWPFMKDLTDDEIRAMWLYLRSLPAVKPRS